MIRRLIWILLFFIIISGAFSLWFHARPMISIGENVSDVAFSPDGQYLAISAKSIQLRQVDDWTVTRTLEGSGSVAWSPDSQRIAATAWGSRDVAVWQTDNGMIVFRYSVPNIVEQISWSYDGEYLAIAMRGGKVAIAQINDTNIGNTISVWDYETAPHIAWYPTKNILLVTNSEGIEFWDVLQNKMLQTITMPQNGLKLAVSTSPDGRYIAASSDERIFVWQSSDGKLVHTLVGHKALVGSLAFSSDGKFLVSSARDTSESWVLRSDTSVRLWDVASGQQIAILGEHSNPVTSVTFSPNAETIASGGLDKVVRLWSIKNITR